MGFVELKGWVKPTPTFLTWFPQNDVAGTRNQIGLVKPHSTPIRIPEDMGIVWESYHKGVPLLGVPGNTLDVCWMMFLPYAHCSLLQVVLGCGLNGYLNTKPNRVFGGLGIVHFESWCLGEKGYPTYSHLGWPTFLDKPTFDLWYLRLRIPRKNETLML